MANTLICLTSENRHNGQAAQLNNVGNHRFFEYWF